MGARQIIGHFLAYAVDIARGLFNVERSVALCRVDLGSFKMLTDSLAKTIERCGFSDFDIERSELLHTFKVMYRKRCASARYILKLIRSDP
jgi:hypothetical protein